MTASPMALLEGLLHGVSRRDLAEKAQNQSGLYRAGGTSGAITDQAGALAYAAARMPATHAAVTAVLAQLVEVLPDFAPASLFDIGAGPGTASFAAAVHWPGLGITMIDHNPAMRALAAQLAEAAGLKANILAGDLAAPRPNADLVIAAYLLAELAEDRAAAVARDLWNSTEAALVLVEPGTPAGFARIRAGRAALIDAGARIAAPCTHDRDCPMRAPDWCHFSQRLARSRDHMRLKDAQLPFEDERYSYVIATRLPLPPRGARILARPLEEKPGLTFKLCEDGALRAQFVPRRDKTAYRAARRLGWGDLF